jgi:Nucleotidyl transferase AbiEii toxin, Type IV TA system
MKFVHEDPEFAVLLTQTADKTGIGRALVEKDYWITHALWALHECGLQIWFKGGTSLSKGFGIIQRFSEDLDLMVEGGSEVGFHRLAIGPAREADPWRPAARSSKC